MLTSAHEELKDLRAEVRVLKADNETLRGMVERLSAESTNRKLAIDAALKSLAYAAVHASSSSMSDTMRVDALRIIAIAKGT